MRLPHDGLDAAPRPKSRRAIEQRAEPRYAAFGASVQLGWWDGPELRTAAGLLKDISRSGAAALAEAAPPKGSAVMMRLNGAYHTDWVEATVIEVTKTRWFRRVPRQVRIQFLEPCPYDVFQAAIDVLVQDCRGSAPEGDVSDGHRHGRGKPRSRLRRSGHRSFGAAR